MGFLLAIPISWADLAGFDTSKAKPLDFLEALLDEGLEQDSEVNCTAWTRAPRVRPPNFTNPAELVLDMLNSGQADSFRLRSQS